MYLDRFNLKGRVAVVTGGAQGIGLACVEALAEAGAHVYIADCNPKAAAEAQAAMKAKGYATDVIEMDVTKSAAVDDAAREGDGGEGPDRHSRLQRRHRALRGCGRGRDRRALAQCRRRQSQRGLLVLPRVRPAHAGGRTRLDRQHRLDVGDHRQPAAAAGLLQRLEGRRASPDEVARRRMGRARRARQRGRADLYQYADDRVRQDQQGDVRRLDRRHADGADGRAGRDRGGRAVPRLRRREPDDRARSWWRTAATPAGEGKSGAWTSD